MLHLAKLNSHFEVIDYEKAKDLKLKVVWYRERREEWDIMRRWLGKYILEESPIHHIAYVFPSRGEGGEGE